MYCRIIRCELLKELARLNINMNIMKCCDALGRSSQNSIHIFRLGLARSLRLRELPWWLWLIISMAHAQIASTSCVILKHTDFSQNLNSEPAYLLLLVYRLFGLGQRLHIYSKCLSFHQCLSVGCWCGSLVGRVRKF